MKILYYCWDECTSFDIMDVFKRKGYEYDCMTTPINNKLQDDEFMKYLEDKLKEIAYDCIFTFNFFPVISKVADKCGIKYISWTYDNPCMTLYTEAVFNTCNYIFIFDRTEVMKLKNIGVKNVYHMPLAVNTVKLNSMLPCSTEFKYDLSFLGRLYNDEYNFYDQIKGMPDYYRGFFDGIINAQMNIYGYDLASDIITEDFENILSTFARFNLGKEMLLKDTDIFVQMLQKKVTVVERFEILKLLSEVGVNVAHFAPNADKRLDKVYYKGYLDYDKQMPLMFNESKINLNISLRSILSGIPLRCLDVMGAGGFLLSNYQPELAEFFADGEEMVMYSSRYDLLDKVQYYLENDDERIEIAHKGKEKIEREFSYDVMLDRMFDVVFG